MVSTEPSNPESSIPFLQLPFRPFFLTGALFSCGAIAWWGWYWFMPFPWQPYGGPIWWHGHEMVFGFGVAIIAGFLLTAVQTWTKVAGLRGKSLLILVCVWLAGRLLVAFGGDLPLVLVAAADNTFLLLVTLAMAHPVIKARQWRNLMFVPMLLLLALLNGASHWGVLSNHFDLTMRSLHAAIMIMILIITVLGGRVIPGFTAVDTGTKKQAPNKWLESGSILSIILIALMAIAGFAVVPAALFVPVALLGALAHGWRLARWGFQHGWKTPLLWSLHLAYLFIPIGMLMLALWKLDLLTNLSAAIHCFTLGALGGMILAMIARISLLHTGRGLQAPALMSLAFIAILLAALFRMLLPGWFPELGNWGIGLASVLWVLAFGIYAIRYAPMLMGPRPDGKPD